MFVKDMNAGESATLRSWSKANPIFAALGRFVNFRIRVSLRPIQLLRSIKFPCLLFASLYGHKVLPLLSANPIWPDC